MRVLFKKLLKSLKRLLPLVPGLDVEVVFLGYATIWIKKDGSWVQACKEQVPIYETKPKRKK